MIFTVCIYHLGESGYKNSSLGDPGFCIYSQKDVDPVQDAGMTAGPLLVKRRQYLVGLCLFL
jgi:hypothetical protein